MIDKIVACKFHSFYGHLYMKLLDNFAKLKGLDFLVGSDGCNNCGLNIDISGPSSDSCHFGTGWFNFENDQTENFADEDLDYEDGDCNGSHLGNSMTPGWSIKIHFYNNFDTEDSVILERAWISSEVDSETQQNLVCDFGSHTFNHDQTKTFSCIWNFK